ncbi:hypothetical protein SynBIOSE41_02912 [Synechococcus sp. BIOS-E4-1]|nr:hypothetical protein SynBIOSE41_02912 [Synechococcus sp. BIOS-E4-1]
MNRGNKILFAPQLLPGWRGDAARYSALACDLLEQSQWRNIWLPKNAHSDQKGGLVPSLKSTQPNASISAALLHHQDALASADG